MSQALRLDQIVQFAENPEPRCPCVLLVDTSGSMCGAPINALNEGLRTFKDDLNRDNLAKKRVEVAIITFDSNVRVVQDFVTAEHFEPPILTTQGLTHMGTAINEALDMIQTRKSLYRANAVSYYRPWVFMITDGEPSGESEEIVERGAQRIRQEEISKRMAFFAVGVENANINRLSQIVARTPVKLKGLNFREMFLWLSGSMQSISHSRTDEQVPLLPPSGWMEV
jgi:uncharacterized protein YegL